MHFERMASRYAGARPPYPPDLFATLRAEGVIGPGTRVLEIGAGSGLATADLVRSGSEVVAVEPGRELAHLLQTSVPEAAVLPAAVEDVELPPAAFDSVVAATSLHWVDLTRTLPRLHRTLRPGGWLAVWRHLFGDPDVRTAFRDRVQEIITRRDPSRSPSPSPGSHAPGSSGDSRPTVEELSADGWFLPARSQTWRWSADLDAVQITRLFATFSDWSPDEVAAAAAAVEGLGGTVTEHYRTVLHLLRRSRPGAGRRGGPTLTSTVMI